MTRLVITMTQKGLREDTVAMFVAQLRNRFPEAQIGSRREELPESRSERFQAAIDTVDGARSDIEELKEELENWKDNLPENLQNGTKADELDEAIQALEDCASQLEEAVGTDVVFPNMF